jgi:hypothetical protein
MLKKTKYLSYEADPQFWRLFFMLLNFVSEEGKIKGNRISFEELKILLWRYNGRLTLNEISKLVGKGVCRIHQMELRALKVLKSLFENRYKQNGFHSAYSYQRRMGDKHIIQSE